MRATASAGARRRPPSARRPRRCPRPARVLGLRCGGGGGPAAVLGVPGRAALPARRALPALRAAGAMRRRCPSPGSALSRAWAPVAFEGPARALVHALKFRGALGVADAMAAQIAAGAPPGLLAAPAALVPVPTHPRRRRVRGFDHADCLAAAIGARTGLAGGALPGPRGSADAPGRLVARGAPGAGAHRHPRARRSTLQRRAGRRCAHHGATLDACASALRRAGAYTVCAVAYARALR